MAEDSVNPKITPDPKLVSGTSMFDGLDTVQFIPLKNAVREIIFDAALNLYPDANITKDYILLEHPQIENYGDYSTNLAMKLAKTLKKAPINLAEEITAKIQEYIKINKKISLTSGSKLSEDNAVLTGNIIESVLYAHPGFINLKIKNDIIISQVERLLREKTGGTDMVLEGRKAAVEYTDPNPFKEFHIGHLYSNLIGESVSKVFEALGSSVWRGDFYGDVGMHVAKSIWGLMKIMSEEKIGLDDIEKKSPEERQNILGKGYARGVVGFEEDEAVKEEIKKLNMLIYISAQALNSESGGPKPIINYRHFVSVDEQELEQVKAVYKAGLRWSLDYFETFYKRLGTRFDGYYPESAVAEQGMQMVLKGLELGILEKSEGSVVYKGEKDGLHTRVFINSMGLPTYEAKDLGLAKAKFDDFAYDYSLNVFGKEIDEYYRVVRAVLRRIDPELGHKANYLAHGMVKLPEGKMSSRTGNIVTTTWLIEETKEKIRKLIKNQELSEDEREEVAEKVALSSIKYALLKNSIGVDVVFDFDKSISFEGDSGPYIMYTYSRCRSVIRKADQGQGSRVKGKGDSGEAIPSGFVMNPEESALIRTLNRFPEAVIEAAKTLSPSVLCTYLYGLAGKYNLFYNKHSILNQKSTPIQSGSKTQNQKLDEKIDFRLFLTAATAQILEKGLDILGIRTVERM